jgi:hypothetical protein
MQHRGNFDVLLHPNTGYERMDHLRWGIWAGKSHKLDLSINSFSFALGSDPQYNCRNSPVIYPLPVSTRKKEPSPGHAHIRYFNAAGVDGSNSFTFTPLLDGRNNGVTVQLMSMEHNWYDDLVVTDDKGVHEVMIHDGHHDSTLRVPLYPEIVMSDTFITFVMLPRVSFSEVAVWYVDEFFVTEGYSKIRFINLLVQSVYITRTLANEMTVTRPPREIVAKLASLDSFYDVVLESQYIYDVCSSGDCSTVVATLPTYMGSGSVNTAYIHNTKGGAEIIFVQDHPQDAPPDVTYKL